MSLNKPRRTLCRIALLRFGNSLRIAWIRVSSNCLDHVFFVFELLTTIGENRMDSSLVLFGARLFVFHVFFVIRSFLFPKRRRTFSINKPSEATAKNTRRAFREKKGVNKCVTTGKDSSIN